MPRNLEFSFTETNNAVILAVCSKVQ